MPRRLRRRPITMLLVVALAATLSLAAAPTTPLGKSDRPCVGNPGQARTFITRSEGERARGLVALPRRAPRGLVVFAHGYGHTSESWRHHLTRTAEQHGVIAIAMNYRGETISRATARGELPSSRGWQVAEGAADSIAAARWFARRCASLDRIVIHGVSMGGNTAGLAAAAGAVRPGGAPLFDYLVAVEPAVNVIETYQAARLLSASGNEFAANATADIERQMGGTFEEVPDAYLERTVVSRVDDIAASGIRGVVLVHGVDDGLVPYNQSREFQAALLAVGVPTELHTVLSRGPGSEAGTTITGTVLGATGVYESPFAGHASETSTTHTVGVTGFEVLARILGGGEVGCGEFLVDGVTGLRTGGSLRC